METEIWKDIDGYEGRYQVSNFGRVKSFWHGEHILKPVLLNIGYQQVTLCANGKHELVRVHRLVAKAFVDNPDNKPQVNHINGDKQDNRATNLEWVTASENRYHAYATGLQRSGENIYNAKLTTEQVLLIRENPSHLSLDQLAELFGVPKASISAIQLGKKYKSVGGSIREKISRRIPAKLCEQIREEYKTGVHGHGTHSLARKYGVSQTAVYNAIRRGDDNTA